MSDPIILVTGAAGQLGQLTIAALAKRVPAQRIRALVRKPEDAKRLAAQGITPHIGDYDEAAGLEGALAGVEQVLLISSTALGRRVAQHGNVIEAARRAGVKRIAYTSVLNAQTEAFGLLGKEHRGTEALIEASGLDYALLRNGWYTENYTAAIPAALAHNVVLGASGEGRIAAAARADYAEAAAMVLTTPQPRHAVYELAGDEAFTLADYAAELSRQSGKTIPFKNLPPAEYEAILTQAGLPAEIAGLLATSDIAAAQGALFNSSRTLSRLTGRPTTTLAQSIKTALGAG